MSPRTVAVLGGGPGGAYVALLLQMKNPQMIVTLYEEFPAQATFGFGVGLSTSTQKSLGHSDPKTFEMIAKSSYQGHGAHLFASSGSVRFGGNSQTAIARADLLEILYTRAKEAGVDLRFGERVSIEDLDAEVIIAADGVSSRTRTERAEEFGANVELGRQMYLWCGTDFPLPDALFAPAETEHGLFTTHAYPYREDRSTFLVETDPVTWRAAGFDATAGTLERGESDQVAIDYLKKTFEKQLQGHPLLGNNTRWTQFRNVKCTTWHHGRIALLGDAAHTAHYSVGSGTKLAMEDAISLATALTEEASVEEAFVRYEEERRPSVERLQYLAERSQFWWESYTRRLDFTPAQMMLSFLTRAGNTSLDAFASREPDVFRDAMSAYAERDVDEIAGGTPLAQWVFDQPFSHGTVRTDSRLTDLDESDWQSGTVEIDIEDPWGTAADALVETVKARSADGAPLITLTGPPTRPALLERLDIAERIRLELGIPVRVAAPYTFTDDLAAGLASFRTDLICFDTRRI
ncbi:FAD-dependent monooxygenase [Rhodococcus sp. (in: high G+C Gram-positive bacteria)]|uniref:FAD-dependent monooxygenase n=1 Tax=Rhodococcus sp. TaxID=1831 RepID=UPI00257F5D57|nr:FAD-dependent monooxygenase [Rhodococcus sp. (in: high G+C Gram-positive bacteria)]MBQ9055221.1 FAD-dependent monooxygenase [Rhodococcus sp. (in: high G+C Gram-positive bacteria)]